MAASPADRTGETMEARLAKLESDVGHIRTDIGDMKIDIREMRGSIDVLKETVASAKIGGVLLYVALAGTMLLTMAKGFKWL
jgi:hypothetical protein